MVSFPTKVEFPDQDSKDKKEPLRIESLSMGDSHGALLTTGHSVYFWGDNAMGQLGLSDTENRTQPFLNAIMEG